MQVETEDEEMGNRGQLWDNFSYAGRGWCS
jgi:hypothetical protein